MEGHVDEDAEGGTLPELDPWEALGQHTVDDRGSRSRTREVNDEGDPGEPLVTVEGVGQVGDALRGRPAAGAVPEAGWWRCAPAYARQRHLPTGTSRWRETIPPENTCECRDAQRRRLEIGLNQCHV